MLDSVSGGWKNTFFQVVKDDHPSDRQRNYILCMIKYVLYI